MAEHERPKKPHYPRKNPSRPPPGVQKAINNFGVTDLRELLDKKHQNQDSQKDKKEDGKKLPPPDPSYNYLRDPAREIPQPEATKKIGDRKLQERPRERHSKKDFNENRSISEQSTRRPRDKDNNITLKESIRRELTSSRTEGSQQKKQLHFADTLKVFDDGEHHSFSSGGRNSFRGRNQRRGRGGNPKNSSDDQKEKIENPVNIKIQLRTGTGQRSCTLDENTKIPDIRHVPDQVASQRSSRGSKGGSRGYYRGRRGRGRGRGSFRGRNGNIDQKNVAGNEAEDLEALHSKDDDQEAAEANEQKEDDNEIDNENEEFADSNEFTSEYNEDNKTVDEEESKEETAKLLVPNLGETITITSSKIQNGNVKRLVEVKESREN